MSTRLSARLLLLCLAGTGLLTSGLLPAHAEADRPPLYAVRPGDALSLIAQRFGVSVEDLRTWNGIDGDRILVGQELRLAPDGSSADGSSEDATTESPASASRDSDAAADAPSDASGAATESGTESATESVTETPRESTSSATESSTRRARPQRPPSGVAYRVRSGETLSGIAVRHGVDVATLLSHNEGLNPDRIRVGQRIYVPEERPAIDYEVQRGDSLARLAARHEVTVAEILRWNPSVRRRGLRAGRTLRLYSHIPVSRSESIGLPYNGSLTNAFALGEHPLYVIREPSRAFGTLETVRWLQEGFDAVRRAHPRGPRVRVHDISDRDGGPLRDHRSHQSGRDVDIAFFRRHCAQNECGFGNTAPGQIDVARQWALLSTWLRSGRVEAIFIDYSLQQPLYDYARSQGATPAQLREWFQYPRGANHAFGIVRHFAHHRDHLHVRFVCPDSDSECRAGWRFSHAH